MSGPVELHTERLVLRPFRQGDVADALAYRDDEEFARFLTHIPQPFNVQDAEALVRTNMTVRWDESPTFAVVLDNRVIGTVNLEVNPQTRAAMLGYAIARALHQRGAGAHRHRADDLAAGCFRIKDPTGRAHRQHAAEAGFARRGIDSRLDEVCAEGGLLLPPSDVAVFDQVFRDETSIARGVA